MVTIAATHTRSAVATRIEIPALLRVVRGLMLGRAVAELLELVLIGAGFVVIVIDPDALSSVTNAVGVGRAVGTAALLTVTSCLTLWALKRSAAGVQAGAPSARTTLTTLVIAEQIAGTMAIAILTGSPTLTIVRFLIVPPVSAVILALLWSPASSRRHFGNA